MTDQPQTPGQAGEPGPLVESSPVDATAEELTPVEASATDATAAADLSSAAEPAVPAPEWTPPPPPPPEPSYGAPSVDSSFAGALPQTASERPEVAVGAAFAGGFLLAMILKRLAR